MTDSYQLHRMNCLGVGRGKVAMSEFIQVHSCGNQVSAALDATKWAIMCDASGI